MNPNQLRKIVRRWTLPVLAFTVVGAAVAYLVSRSLTPIYEARGDVLVVAGPSQAAGSSALNINATQATTTAAILITEPPLLQRVIDALHLPMITGDLAREVTATPQNNTELVDVVVSDPSASRAAQIDNAVMTTYVQQITDENTQRLSKEGAVLQSQITQVQSSITQEQKALAAAQQGHQDTTALQSTISSNTALLTQLTLNYSSFISTQGQNLETVSVAAAASIPLAPASPRASLNALLGGAGGLVLAVGLVSLFEYLDQGLHSAEDVMTRLGVPCLGVIPRYKTAKAGVSVKGSAKHRRGNEAASEAYRRLRTNVLFATPDMDLNSIVLTSVRSGEGKTCTAANLAVSLASSEKRVLLVDADMRRPDQHRLFGKALGNGMSEMILQAGSQTPAPLTGLHRTQFDNLSLLTSGTIPPNPSELLSSRRAHLLLEGLALRHDLLVIDTPPAGVVTDALSLAANASLTLVVVEAGRTNATQAANVIDSLRSIGANAIGVVLNKARGRDLAGYYYHYGSYGKDAGDGRGRESAFASGQPGSAAAGVAPARRPGETAEIAVAVLAEDASAGRSADG